MAKIKREDMIGAYIGEELICVECLTEEEDQKLEENQIFTEDERDKTDDFFFCDRCKKQL
jgi:hypothetical protein